MRKTRSLRLIFSLCISVFILYYFTVNRSIFHSQEYRNRITEDTKNIEKFARSHFKIDEITNADISEFAAEVNSKTSSVAGIFFFENGSNIFSAVKSELFRNKEDIEKFKDLYNSKKLSRNTISTTFISEKNYQYFIFELETFDIVIAFTYRFPLIIIVKFIFEYVTLLSILTVFIILLYNGKSFFILLKNRKLTPVKKQTTRPASAVSDNSEYTISDKASLQPEIQGPTVTDISIDTREIKVESLEAFSFEFFRKISTNYGLTRISLNIYDDEKNITVKTYESKGLTFARLSQENNSGELKVLVKELKKGAHIHKNQGKNIFFPLLDKEKFLGYLEIERNEAISGEISAKLSAELKTLENRVKTHLEKK